MVILYALVALLAAVAGAGIALWIQSLMQKKQREQRQAWERAQEDHLQLWESQQEKRVADLGAKLTAQSQQLQQAWKHWVAQEIRQATALSEQYKAALRQLKVDHELLRVMRVEETPLTTSLNGQQQPAFSNWRPVALQGADLKGHDLSHRYLGKANLREAQLSGATFFMANLSGASLAKADLTGADLSGVDLSGADLRDAVLSDTNLLVADLHNANLTGANLLGARGLTAEQIHSAIYDSTTLFDADFDLTPSRHDIANAGMSAVADSTQARIEAVHPVQSPPTAAPPPGEAPASKLEMPAPWIEEATVNTASPALEPEMPAPPVEAAPATSTEPEEFPGEPDLSAGQAPPEPEPEAPAVPSEPSAEQAPLELETGVPTAPSDHMLDKSALNAAVAAAAAPTAVDAPPEVEIAPAESPESPDLPVPQAAADTSPEALQEPGTAAAVTTIAEAPAPIVSPETTETHDTSFAEEDMDMLPLSFLPDMTSFIQHLDEPALMSPLTPGNSLLDPAVADLLADHTHIGEFDTATPNRKDGDKEAAKEE